METVSPEELRAMANFRHHIRNFLAFSKQHPLPAVGITPEQYEALLSIKVSEQPPCIADLADRLQVKHHTAISTVNALVKRKFIKRVTARDDRRKVLLHLTPTGADAVGQLAAAHRPEIRRRSVEMIAALEQLRM